VAAKRPEGPFGDNCPVYGVDNLVRAAKGVVRAESQHTVAMSTQPAIARGVLQIFVRVLGSIDLDHKPLGGTAEIDYVGSDRRLPAKLQSSQLTAAQP
jgi:hypothetical protein